MILYVVRPSSFCFSFPVDLTCGAFIYDMVLLQYKKPNPAKNIEIEPPLQTQPSWAKQFQIKEGKKKLEENKWKNMSSKFAHQSQLPNPLYSMLLHQTVLETLILIFC